MHTCTHKHSLNQQCPNLNKRWDTEFSQSLGQYCCCVYLALSDTRTNHAHLPIRTTTHTDLEAVDELISDSLADWRASPAPRRARLRWWRRWPGCTSYDDGGREGPVYL